MKKISNTPFTLEELGEEARKRNEILYKQYARHLCSETDIVLHEDGIVPYFAEICRGNNFEATVHWLKTYMVEQDLVFSELDLKECVDVFRAELHNRIPSNFWGGGA
jgi:hypothetical protein